MLDSKKTTILAMAGAAAEAPTDRGVEEGRAAALRRAALVEAAVSAAATGLDASG